MAHQLLTTVLKLERVMWNSMKRGSNDNYQLKRNLSFIKSRISVSTLEMIINQWRLFCEKPPKGFEKYFEAGKKLKKESKPEEKSASAPRPSEGPASKSPGEPPPISQQQPGQNPFDMGPFQNFFRGNPKKSPGPLPEKFILGAAITIIVFSYYTTKMSGQEISYKDFVNNYLSKNLVEKLECYNKKWIEIKVKGGSSFIDFTLDFYFRQFWTDPRLGFRKKPGVETLSVGSDFIKNIWVPDTFFVNEKQSYFHIATTSNEFIRIHHSGSITRSIRLTITASCPMNLQYFPMDRQLCHIEIESFGYTMRDIRYKWNAGLKSVGISNEVELPQFRVLGHRQRATEINLSTVGYTMRDIRYKWNEGPNSVGVSNEVSLPQFKVLGHRQRAMEISLTTGNYSRLACEIQFVRSMGYYLIQIYIPSGLIVIISWVSFWLNRNATPARVALGVTTVLTMTTLMSSTNAALPKISYVKSIDVYLGTCFVMVFASLLEYATVGYMAKRIQMRKSRFMAIQKIAEQKNKASLEAQHGPLPGPPSEQDHAGPKQTVRFKVHDPKAHSKGGTLENTINGRADEEAATPAPQHLIHPGKDINKLMGITPSDIDKYSRIVFPVCFICFNLMYWIIYLHISDVVADDLVLLGQDK